MIFEKIKNILEFDKIKNIKNKLISKLELLIKNCKNINLENISDKSHKKLMKILVDPKIDNEIKLSIYNNLLNNLKENGKIIKAKTEKIYVNYAVKKIIKPNLIKNQKEYNFINDMIKSCYTKEELNKQKLKYYPIYYSNKNSDSKKEILKLLNYWWNVIILIQTNTNKIFGVFIHKFINLSFNNKLTDDKLYFFDLEKLEYYKSINNGENIIEFSNEEGIIMKIGNNDLILYENFITNQTKSFSNFPNYFEYNNKDINQDLNPLLNESKGYFNIKNIEIFAITPPRDAKN
jgi:hypothetical protein